MPFHKLCIIGRLVGDPRVNNFANGGRVAKIGLPVDFTRRKKNPETGQWEGESFIIDVDCFNRENGQQLADIVMQYLKKGSQVYVEGRLKLNEYTNREGVKVTKTVLVADMLQMLDRPEGSTGEGMQQRAPTVANQRAAAPMAPQRSAPAQQPAYDDEPDGPPPSGEPEGEIPF